VDDVRIGEVAVFEDTSGENGIFYVGFPETAALEAGILEEGQLDIAGGEINIPEITFGEIAYLESMSAEVVIPDMNAGGVQVLQISAVFDLLNELLRAAFRIFYMMEAVFFSVGGVILTVFLFTDMKEEHIYTIAQICSVVNRSRDG